MSPQDEAPIRDFNLDIERKVTTSMKGGLLGV